jgi:hypothetical protein
MQKNFTECPQNLFLTLFNLQIGSDFLSSYPIFALRDFLSTTFARLEERLGTTDLNELHLNFRNWAEPRLKNSGIGERLTEGRKNGSFIFH